MQRSRKYAIKGANDFYYITGLELYAMSTGLGDARLYNNKAEATTRMKTLNKYLPKEYKPLEVVPVTTLVQEDI